MLLLASGVEFVANFGPIFGLISGDYHDLIAGNEGVDEMGRIE